MKGLTALVAPVLLVSWTSLHAHHSTASFFFLDQRISVEGTVVEFHARNPHGLIVFDVVNEAGETERWRAEMPAWQALLRWLGWSPGDLQPGDRIVIHGAPPRMNESFSIRADDIVMPDGWTRHMFRDPVTNKYRKPTPPDRRIAELDGVWELNRGWTDHPDDNPDTYERTDFRPWTLPEVLAVWEERDPLSDPKLDCEPPTVSAAMSGIHAIAIDQSGEHVKLFAEAFDVDRTVYMDGRSHPGEDAHHTHLGHSVGRYEGDALVVDTTHITAGLEYRARWSSPQRPVTARGALPCNRRRPVAGTGDHRGRSPDTDPAGDLCTAPAQGADSRTGALRLHAPEYGSRRGIDAGRILPALRVTAPGHGAGSRVDRSLRLSAGQTGT